MERFTIDVDGPVSIVDHGGEGPLIVCVHGLEGSAYNWNLIAPELTKTHRVVAPDLSGFGYTPPVDRGSAVEVNADLVAGVIKHFGDRAIVIGNSMGGLISILAATRHPDLVAGLVLVNPAAPVTNWFSVRPAAVARLSTPIIPVVGGRAIDAYRATQTPEQSVDEGLAFVCAEPDKVDPRVREFGLEVSRLRRTQDWPTAALVEAMNSIAPYVLWKRRFAKLLHQVSQPTLLIHGTEDALVQVASAQWMARERPDWTAAFFDGVGHVPMMETPEKVLEVFNAWENATFATAKA
ncbi:MAG: alpha/beta fold hydrolase [Acidimicrobiia bacterium]